MANETNCALCGTALTSFRYRPMPQWNISGVLCSQCYDKRLLEHYIQPDRRSITKK
ncbi:MAG TPA: hypothetical protein VJL54_06010 [Nitrososphaera sp.]|nr:hypothetical protein [Nitrososphaera sp.]